MTSKGKTARSGAVHEQDALHHPKGSTKAKRTQEPKASDRPSQEMLRALASRVGVAPLWTWSAPGLTPAARLVLSYAWAIASPHGDHDSARISEGRLARELCLTEAQVRRLTGELTAHGYLEIQSSSWLLLGPSGIWQEVRRD